MNKQQIEEVFVQKEVEEELKGLGVEERDNSK